MGYREHVAAASPLAVFNVQRHPDGWKRVKTLRFASDARGLGHFQQYLDRNSPDPADFLVLLEPTGGNYGLSLLLHLLSRGYRVLQVENRALKGYREKVFGSESKSDEVDARLLARMGFLHELVGEEFSIQDVHLANPDAAALRVMVRDLSRLRQEITRRRNQLLQIAAATFPELKTFFTDRTTGRAAQALLAHFPTPRELAAAEPEAIAAVLRQVCDYAHAKRAAELRDLARHSAGATMLAHQEWRQDWILRQLVVLEDARRELVEELRRAIASHPYTPLIESLPVRSPIWTATLIAVIGDIDRFHNYGEFKAYLGWYPQVARSGTSLNTSSLAKGGVRSSRNVLGQMAVTLLSPSVRSTPFRVFYERLLARGMRRSNALGHLAGKLSVVLYGLLKTRAPYDEVRHGRELGLPPPDSASDRGSVEAPVEFLEALDGQGDLDGETLPLAT